MKSALAILTFISCCSLNLTYSQTDFDNYRTLQSAGALPEDFTSNTFEKVSRELKQNRNDLSGSQKKEFFRGIHYGIDEILHSGNVVYGDEVSNYVSSIAEKLLKDDPKLFSKLRFYTLKSNETNAFSTDQGIIFVTVGLIARLENEAQLAFVLAHEISHFTKHHVINSFKFNNSEQNQNIRSMSIYSRDNELEADRVGLELYQKAGYKKEEALNALSVLNHTRFPFAEVAFPKNYFNTADLTVPDTLFKSERIEITSYENIDDSKSSHPNVKSRKEALNKLIESYTMWGNDIYHFGKDKFITIQNSCRFENVRMDVMLNNYIDAIYCIHILEQDFPSSSFLKNMKAQAFLGLHQLAAQGELNYITRKNHDLEGEVAPLHSMLGNLSPQSITAIALSQIHGLSIDNPNNKELSSIYNFFISDLKGRFGNSPNDIMKEDSVNFYVVGAKNIITHPDFIAKYESSIIATPELSNSKISSVLVVEPQVICYNRKTVDLVKSEKLKRDFSDVLAYSGDLSSLDVNVIDRDNLKNSGTEAFNERNILFAYMFQLAITQKMNRYPVDNVQLNEIRTKYNTSKIMLIFAEQEYNNSVFASFILLPTYPIASIVIPMMLMKRNNTVLNMIVFDIDNNKVVSESNYSFNEKPKKYNLGAHMYAIFESLSTDDKLTITP